MRPPLVGPTFPYFFQDLSENQIEVYWYEQDFTQSRYPPGQEVSEACTLICLLLAQRICQEKLIIWDIKRCTKLTILMAEAIVEGNKTHAWIVKNGLTPHPYLSTDEALRFGGPALNSLKEWKFAVYRENMEKTLCHNIKRFLHEWYLKPKADMLFMLLIARGRTVLFIFQEQSSKVTLFDSHEHKTSISCKCGLVVAQTKIQKLHHLCQWYIEAVLYNSFSNKSDEYELAFLYENCPSPCSCNQNAICECGCLDRS